MTEDKRTEWYSNRELYDQIGDLRNTLSEAMILMRQYNGLREETNRIMIRMNNFERQFGEHCQYHDNRTDFVNGLRIWGGWIVAVAGGIWALLER